MVNISPAMRWLSHAPRSMGCSPHTCETRCTLTRWVLRTCLSAWFFPVATILNVAWLSSRNTHLICLFNIASNRVIQGNASVLRPRSAATISDSAVEWLTAPCFLLNAQSGKYRVGPPIAQTTPETLFEVDLSAAKSASMYSHIRQSADLPPIQPNIKVSTFW